MDWLYLLEIIAFAAVVCFAFIALADSLMEKPE